MRTDEFETQLKGGRLTTAEVLYYMPDHPKLLQSFMWQTLDVAPEYPRVHSFLEYWRKEIQAVIHSVRLSTVGIVTPARVRFADMVGTLN
ncbi:Usg family protein [Caulobacter sp. S45]|uniref:Usg family protein n=1 Tax=Caulobacter sp. S45 TaxID=1641861 RepID=UPI001575F021|nr:Usg family protein [Caulobacter sp. S45]